jgi:hypothetical protein
MTAFRERLMTFGSSQNSGAQLGGEGILAADLT